jgi:hypothetical protein
MAIFDRPSLDPLPEKPDFEDVKLAATKGVLSKMPFLGETFSLIFATPLEQRRNDWFRDLESRLRELEEHVKGFRIDDLSQNQDFVSATWQATQAALKTHHAEKHKALRNAVLNIAVGNAPSDDLQTLFLNMIDTFTPKHLEVLNQFKQMNFAALKMLRNQRDLSDQVVIDLNNRGLISDTRPYAARNRDAGESLVTYMWDVTPLGTQFLEFITSPEVRGANGN